LTYFKRPAKPVYAVGTAVSGQYTYTETGSTDLEWSETMVDIIVQKTLPFLGLAMKDGSIMRAEQLQPGKEASTV